MEAVEILQPFCVLFAGLLNTVYARERIFFPDEINTWNGLENSNSLRNTCYIDGKRGECLPLNMCPKLLSLVKFGNGIRTPGIADYLRKRICERKTRDVKLCCPTEPTSITPLPVPTTTYINITLSSILPSMNECGTLSFLRITNGKNFTHGTHPWLVGVGYMNANVSLKVQCGGTLITKKHVLSAAHCFVRSSRTLNIPENTHVILGEHSLSKDIERKRPVVLLIAEVIIHPEYNIHIYSHDISLLVLEREVDFTNYIRPACLPFLLKPEDMDLSTRKVIVTGWGKRSYCDREGTDEPLEAEVSLIPKPTCQDAYSFAREVLIDDTKICFGGEGKDACQGDSGGPLIYRETTKFFRFFLIGAVSFGFSCGSSFYPGVYTYVPEYLSWINENVGDGRVLH